MTSRTFDFGWLWAEDLERILVGSAALTLLSASLLLLSPLWLTSDAARPWCAGTVALLALLYARHLRWLRRLYATGVEVEGVLEGVENDFDGETSWRHASYGFELSGKRYTTRVTTSGFLSRATKYGPRALFLIDPVHPTTGIPIRPLDERG